MSLREAAAQQQTTDPPANEGSSFWSGWFGSGTVETSPSRETVPVARPGSLLSMSMDAVPDWMTDIRLPKGGRSIEEQLETITERVSKLECEGVSFYDKVNTLESIFSQFGKTDRVLHYDEALRAISRRIDLRRKTAPKGRVAQMLKENPDLTESEAWSRVQQEDAEDMDLYQEHLEVAMAHRPCPKENSDGIVRGADLYFASLSECLVEMEAACREQGECLENFRREFRAQVHVGQESHKGSISELQKREEVLTVRMAEVEERMSSVEADARRAVLQPRGGDTRSREGQGPSLRITAPLEPPGQQQPAREDGSLIDLQSEVERLDLALCSLQTPVSRCDQHINSLECKTNAMSTKLDRMEAMIKDLTRKSLEWNRGPKKRSWLDITSRLPNRSHHANQSDDPPADETDDQDGTAAALRLKGLEDSLARLDRRFHGFIAELNGLPILESPL